MSRTENLTDARPYDGSCTPANPCDACRAALRVASPVPWGPSKTTGPLPPRSAQPQRNIRDFVAAIDKGASVDSAMKTSIVSGNPKDLLGVLKTPLRFIPAPSLAFLAKVMELGARKYGAFNWRSNKVKRTVYLEAALRHILSAIDGEDNDPESGEPHEAHAMACMGIVLDAKATGNLIDDRSTPGVFGKLVQEGTRPTPAKDDGGWVNSVTGCFGTIPESARGLIVDVKLRDGTLMAGISSSNFHWGNSGPCTVIAYRPARP